jgi:4,5-DOPA dioxygenase extradiol
MINKTNSISTAASLFVSHGAPTFALEPGRLGPQLTAFGAQQRDLRAVLVISAHWQTRGVEVMTTVAPATMHDFGGFPDALYQLRYPAAGAPELAAEAAQLLRSAGYTVSASSQRGLDHGAWVPLRFLRPQADIPVFQVSMPFDLDAAGAGRMGATLQSLRASGVMILGSGSLTHNLGEFSPGAQPAAGYVQEFSDWVRGAVERNDLDALLRYQELAPHARRAHPTAEHFLPLLVAMGARQSTDRVTVLEGGITNGMLSMDSFAWSGG